MLNYDWIRFIYARHTNSNPERKQVRPEGYGYENHPTPGASRRSTKELDIDWDTWDMLNMWEDIVTPAWRLWVFSGSHLRMRTFRTNPYVGVEKLDATSRNIFPGKAKPFDLIHQFRHIYDDQPSSPETFSDGDDDVIDINI